jgi:dTDP-4-dehydrorhamnose 3,5-epimerase
MIDGIETKKLRVMTDERGWLMEILRGDDKLFQKFGQVYLTTAYPGVVKAWHYHKKQTDNCTCIKGMMKLVLYDDRDESPTKGEVNEFFIGDKNPMLICIPPGIYHGFKAMGGKTAYFLNIPTELYNYNEPDEYRLPPDTGKIPYKWLLEPGKKHG